MSSAGTVDSKLLAAQQEAIRESGWAERFHLWQPQNAAFWVWLVGVVAGLIVFIKLIAQVPDVYGPAVVGGVVVWSLFVIAWVVFLQHKDRYAPTPGLLAAAGFFWGGLAATFAISAWGNDAVTGIYAKAVSPEFAARWGTVLSAPVVEESAKACGIILLIALAPRLVRSAWDGLILGAFVGLGFQVFESWIYTVQGASSNLGENQPGTVVQQALLRGVYGGLFMHALWSALAGMGIIWLIGRPGEPRRPLRGILLIGAAVAGHAAWNVASAPGAGALFLATGVIAIIAIIVMIFAERAAATRERGWIRDIMAPEVARGTIDEPELDALAGRYAHRRRYIKSARGRAGRRRARQVINASLDLAEDIARSGGRETPEVASARSEAARVRATR
jgi:RsiW-degrading membrane proteinase PrsW (M82 family)